MSLVVDDLVSVSPWKVRGIKILGVADLITRDGYAGLKTYMRVEPKRKWSWGVEEQ